MSASLVGSEMCIRDRQPPASNQFTAKRTLVQIHTAANTLHCGRGSQDAVSYTHLTLPTICSV
eukprot:10956592-Alexandrium_andersonii.AAC.1